MSATKTLAFALKTQDYRDTSLLGSFYTRDFGKVRGIVKGIRDSKARFGTLFEPFSLNEILFYRRRRGGDLHQITQGELVDAFPAVREDLERLSYASYFVDLLNEISEPEEPSPEIFDLLRDTLHFVGSGASCRRAARIFEVKLFELLGLAPEIRQCVICRAEGPDPAMFSVPLGGIRCRTCDPSAGGARRGAAAEPPSGFPVSKGTLLFLDHVMREPVKDLHRVKVSQEVGEELEKTLRRFVDFHLPKKLKSVSFLEKMEMASW